MGKFLRKTKKGLRSEKGNLMIEAVVGLTLITVGMLGVFSLISSSLKTSQEVGNRFIAANLAAEGVEVVKNIIDTNVAQRRSFNAGISSGDYMINYDSTSLNSLSDSYLYLDNNGTYSHSGGSKTIFRRVISVTDRAGGSQSYIGINSKVIWSEAGNVKEVSIEDRFYEWR
jgi:Flp pilus assembly pilin Flp